LSHALNAGHQVDLFNDLWYVVAAADPGVFDVASVCVPWRPNPRCPEHFRHAFDLPRTKLKNDMGFSRFNAARKKFYETTRLDHWRHLERTALPYHGLGDSTSALNIAEARNAILQPIFNGHLSRTYQSLKHEYKWRTRSAYDGAARDLVQSCLRLGNAAAPRLGQREKVLLLWGNGVFSHNVAGEAYNDKLLAALLRRDDVVVVDADEYGSSKHCPKCLDPLCESFHRERRVRRKGGGVGNSAMRALSIGTACGRESSRDGGAAAAIALNVFNILNKGVPITTMKRQGKNDVEQQQQVYLARAREYAKSVGGAENSTIVNTALGSGGHSIKQARVMAQILHVHDLSQRSKTTRALERASSGGGDNATRARATAAAASSSSSSKTKASRTSKAEGIA